KDAAQKSSGNAHILGDDIAFHLTAGLQNKANRIDSSDDDAVDMKIGFGFEQASCHDGSTQMRRRQVRAVAIWLAVCAAGKGEHRHQVPSKKSDSPPPQPRGVYSSDWRSRQAIISAAEKPA